MLIEEGIKQLDNVVMVARSQDVDLYDVILQLLFALRLDHFGGSQDARVFVPGLKRLKKKKKIITFNVISAHFMVSW